MKKLIISIISIIIITMFIIPLIIMNISSPTDVMGIAILLFFITNPIISIVVGALSGRNIKKLWYFSLTPAIIFPIFFGIIIKEFVFELYIYSIGYLILGIISMLISSSIRKTK